MGKDGTHHIIPLPVYRNILLALLFFTLLTVLCSKKVTGFDVGAFNPIIAVLIASVKAFLVGAYFMHLKYDDKQYALWIISTVFFLLTLLVFSALDLSTRVYEVSPL